uniref:Fibrinogen C-terminal domain-containing protein n=1 Tax=Anopheles dirus TaxID=7168 RepID=A0A182NVM1_9DIPT
MLIHLEAFESRLNERLELLSQKVDTVKAEAIQMASISKLEDQLKEIRKENSANFERVARSISTLDKKVKVFENTNTNAFTNLRGNITLLSSKLGTSVKDLSDSGKELSKHLEQQMEQLTSYSGVYSMLYPGHSVGFHMYREGLQSHGYGGGWIVFQRRFDGSVGFNRSWEEYDDGFAFESRLNERLELLSQKVDIVKAEAVTSISKLEDQLKEILTENSAVIETVKESISTLDEKLKEFENTNRNAITSLRSYITLLSSELSISVVRLKESDNELSNHLEQRMEQLTSYSGVYSMLYPGHSVGFHMYREGLQSHGYGSGWIVFQRRFDGSVGFNRSWEEYDDGFGDLRGEHCLGLRKLRKIVTTERHELLIELEDFLGQLQYAKYDNFLVANVSEGFQLKSLGSYTGTAGDSLSPHIGKVFATFDKNDAHNCARSFGGGWWFDNCYHAYVSVSTHIHGIAGDNLNCISCYRNLNGRYRHRGERHNSGVSWNAIRKDYSLKSSKMMFRSAAAEVSGFGYELLLLHLQAFESRLNERLELLSQKVDSVKAEAVTSISKLEDQLMDIRKENSAMIETVKEPISTLDEKLKEFENTNRNAFTSLRSYITQVSNELSTSVEDLSDSGKELSENLEQRMQVLTSYSGVYSWLHPDDDFGFFMYREGLQSNGYGSDWIVFRRRIDGSVEFNRSWTEYKHGFGDLRGEHWLGLNKLWNVIFAERHELLVEVEDFYGQICYAKYDDFKMENFEGFKLKSLGSYSGTAGDSLSPHIGKVFATFDKNDAHNCARSYGGGWWFDKCYNAHLNGRYRYKHELYNTGVAWNGLRKDYSMKSSKMMVRPYSKRDGIKFLY